MLITKEILIRKKLIYIKDLSLNSHKYVTVKCDNCGNKKDIRYQSYNKSTDNGTNKYYCNNKDCINLKRKLSIQSKYGVDNVSQLNFVQDKKIKINLEKYGVEYLTQSDKIKEKIKKVNQKKYGQDWITQTDNFKEKSKKTNLERYGVDHPLKSNIIKEKSKQTNLERYGVDHPLKSNIIKEKSKQTNLERYGVEHYMLLDEFKEKQKETNLERYGVDNPMKLEEFVKKLKLSIYNKYGVEHYMLLDEFKEKQKETNLERYGVEYYSQSNNYKEKVKKRKICNIHNKYGMGIDDINNDIIKVKCNICENIFDTSYQLLYNRHLQNKNLCTICNPINSFSENENSLKDFIIDNYNGNVILNSRYIISPYELDIYLPELKLAFEFNGLYWHNELYKEKNYHLNKTELCGEQGIQLIHIYEDDWEFKKDIIKSMIKNKLGESTNKIYARKTKIKEIIDNKLVRNFLDDNHRQGFIGSFVKLGLFYENELVSLMTFGKKRKIMNSVSNGEEYELLRFCSKLNTNVVGGANKLFKYFIKNYNPKEITTYADRSWSNGNLYEQLGFDYKGKTLPNYYYIVNRKRKYRFGYRKDILIKAGYSKDKSERQIMLDRKIYRIYDSGNLKYTYSN